MSLNGISGGGGVGSLMADWMIDGRPSIPLNDMDIRRFGPHYSSDLERTIQQSRETYKFYYSLHYPRDEREWGRKWRKSALFERLLQEGGVIGEKNGWERANYFDASSKPGRLMGVEQSEWGFNQPPYFHIVGEECKAIREDVGMIDMTSFGKTDVIGPDALKFLQIMAANQVDKPVGSLIYTQFLSHEGGIESDVTICRLGDEHFRVITGSSFQGNDVGWMERNKEELGVDVNIEDVSDQFGVISVWGPNSRNILSSSSLIDSSSTGFLLSNESFPFMTGKYLPSNNDINNKIWIQRVSYVGELGYELYIPFNQMEGVWDSLREMDVKPCGYYAIDSLRLEKGYRYWSADITPDENPFEAGLAFAVKMKKDVDFIGRAALIQYRKEHPKGTRRRLMTMVLESEKGRKGQVPIFGGEAISCPSTGDVIGRLTSAGYGHYTKQTICLGYLPPNFLQEGSRVNIDICGEDHVAVVCNDSIYDPENESLKG